MRTVALVLFGVLMIAGTSMFLWLVLDAIRGEFPRRGKRP